MRKLNNKGFTLVELLAVIVILVVIMGIALPNISSSIERSNDKKEQAMIKVFKSEAGLYISKHKASIINKLTSEGRTTCYIKINDLVTDGYLVGEDVAEYESDCLIYNRTDLDLTYDKGCSIDTSLKCYGNDS